jgi:hypothetical protein
MANLPAQEVGPVTERGAKARLLFVRCCRLLAVGTALAGVLLVLLTTAVAPEAWDAFLWNSLFLGVPTVLLTSFFVAMAAISSNPSMPWQRIVRDFIAGLAGALAVPIGMAILVLSGKMTPISAFYFLIGLVMNYVLWKELRALPRAAPDGSLEAAGAPDTADGASTLGEGDSAVA